MEQITIFGAQPVTTEPPDLLPPDERVIAALLAALRLNFEHPMCATLRTELVEIAAWLVPGCVGVQNHWLHAQGWYIEPVGEHTRWVHGAWMHEAAAAQEWLLVHRAFRLDLPREALRGSLEAVLRAWISEARTVASRWIAGAFDELRLASADGLIAGLTMGVVTPSFFSASAATVEGPCEVYWSLTGDWVCGALLGGDCPQGYLVSRLRHALNYN